MVIIFEPFFIAVKLLIDVQYVPVRWIDTASRNSFTLAFVNAFTGPDTPALLTTMSTVPNCFLILSNIEFIPASSATSTPGQTVTEPEDPTEAIIWFKRPAVSLSGSFLLPIITMLAPLSANFLAIACPIPAPLPVITTVLWLNFKGEPEDICCSTKFPHFQHY